MGKKARNKSATTSGDASAVGPRQPCPCGSGKRYKACHGSADGGDVYVVKTFEGLPAACDWVALREFVPAAKARVTLRDDAFDGSAKGTVVSVVTVLPGDRAGTGARQRRGVGGAPGHAPVG